MHFLSIIDKNLVINDDVFKYTNEIRLMHDGNEICIISKNDSRSVYYDAPKGQVIKMYMRINDDWLYYEKAIYNYDTIQVNQEHINELLLRRKNLIKEILGYEISL